MNNEILSWRTFGNVQAYCLDDDALYFLDLKLTPSEWLMQHGTRLKSDKNKISSLVQGPGNRVFFVKQFSANRIWHKLRYMASTDQACRLFRTSQALSCAGVPVPSPLAVILDFKVFRGFAYFISEALTDFVTLENKVKKTDQQSIFKEIMPSLAILIANMHSAGFYHGDMKWNNILIHPEKNSKIYFTDLDSIGYLKDKADKRYAMDISRFCISLYESLYNIDHVTRFIQIYSDVAQRDPKTVAEHMRPYHCKRAAKHKLTKHIDIPDITIKT